VARSSFPSEPLEVVSDGELRSFVDDADESILITEKQLERPGPRILYVNRAFTRLTGFSAEDALGRTPRMLQGPKTDREVLARLKRNLLAGDVFTGETVNYRKNGEEFVVQWYAQPVRDASGAITKFVGVQRDVSAVRHNERLAQRLEAAFDSLQEIVLILSPDLTVQYVNPALARLTGESRRFLMGSYLSRLPFFQPAVEGGDLLRVIEGLAPGGSWQGELPIRNASGQILTLESSLMQLSFEGNAGIVLVGRDRTQERRLESIASALNMTENTGYIFAGLRHELGNPVNSLKSALTVVRQNQATFSAEKLASYMDRMAAEVSRMEYLLGALRSVNPGSSVRLTDIQVSEFLVGFIPLIQQDLTRRAISLRVALASSDLGMRGDPRALHQVLLNIVTNAADALEGREEPEIALSIRPSGDETQIVVEDNGSGMTDEQLERLFQPFNTTKTHGTGLGMVITQRLVAQMSGTMKVSSEFNVGTRVTLSFEQP